MENLISVVIVTWNNEDTIKDCIQSVNYYIKNTEIIIVDNNSSDKTLHILKEFSQVRVFSLSQNMGFAYANNYGVRFSTGNRLLFLNPDIVVKSNLRPMEDYLTDGVGMVSGKIINLDGTLQPSCYSFENPINNFLAIFILGKFFPEIIKRKKFFRWANHEHIMYPDWVMGSFMYISKKTFLEVEGFSEDYFLYAEDMDICYKLYLKRYKTIYVPSFLVMHIGGVSERKSSNDEFSKIGKSIKSSKIFAKKFHLKNNITSFIEAYRLRVSILQFINIFSVKSHLKRRLSKLISRDKYIIKSYKETI